MTTSSTPLRRGLPAAGLAMALALAASLPGAALAADYPSRPITLVVPQAPGGNADYVGRLVAQKLGEKIGQTVVVENKPGAGGTIGTASVARSAPDGYTLVLADTGTHSIAPELYGKSLQYDVFKSFTPVTWVAQFPAVLLLHPSVPADTPQEFVKLVREHPGQYNYGSAGVGNGSHLAQDLFLHAAGDMKMVHVPYKGGAPAIQALVTGEVQMGSVSVNTALPFLKSGRVKALAVPSFKRSDTIPDVPTLREAGIEGAESDNWFAVLGPAGMDAQVVGRLNDALVQALHDADLAAKFKEVGVDVVARDGQAFTQMLAEDEKKWGEAVRRSGASAQ